MQWVCSKEQKKKNIFGEQKLDCDILKTVPVPRGDIDSRLIRVYNWLNSQLHTKNKFVILGKLWFHVQLIPSAILCCAVSNKHCCYALSRGVQ